jgi:CheY-like chemotaxis protein
MDEQIKRHTLLVVDDEPVNIKIFMEMLRSDYTIKVSTDGEKALQIAQSENPPDLILLDVMMPGMDGYEVCRRLKADERTRYIPVIFITAKTGEEDETKGFEVGALDYVTKPFRPVVVKARVATHLSLKLAMEKLKLQNIELLESARLKEDVYSIMKHDLKTPLNGIISMPEIILEEGNLNQEQIECLKIMEDSAYVMLDMINRSLDLFKMERGIYELCPVPVNVLKLIDKIVLESKAWIKPKNIDINILLNRKQATPEDSFMIFGDNLLCYSMLANIIKNAIEASPKNEMVTISINNENGPTIKVHNMGAIPENIRDRFFEKYATSGKNKGTGLGTYSAMLIAKTMGCNMLMNTDEVEGTTITVSLPAAQT